MMNGMKRSRNDVAEKNKRNYYRRPGARRCIPICGKPVTVYFNSTLLRITVCDDLLFRIHRWHFLAFSQIIYLPRTNIRFLALDWLMFWPLLLDWRAPNYWKTTRTRFVLCLATRFCIYCSEFKWEIRLFPQIRREFREQWRLKKWRSGIGSVTRSRDVFPRPGLPTGGEWAEPEKNVIAFCDPGPSQDTPDKTRMDG